jgi:hypothetical protein
MAELDIGMEEISAHYKLWVISAKDLI